MRPRVDGSGKARPASISLTPNDRRLAREAASRRGIHGLTELFRAMLKEDPLSFVGAMHDEHRRRETVLVDQLRRQAQELENLRARLRLAGSAESSA